MGVVIIVFLFSVLSRSLRNSITRRVFRTPQYPLARDGWRFGALMGRDPFRFWRSLIYWSGLANDRSTAAVPARTPDSSGGSCQNAPLAAASSRDSLFLAAKRNQAADKNRAAKAGFNRLCGGARRLVTF